MQGLNILNLNLNHLVNSLNRLLGSMDGEACCCQFGRFASCRLGPGKGIGNKDFLHKDTEGSRMLFLVQM